MFAVKQRRAAVAALALTLVTAACGGDEVLGSADVAACTAGTLTVNAGQTGAVTAESCLLWHDYQYEFYLSESWTIKTAANTAYIVRLVPTEDDNGDNTWDGEISLFARNAAGDPSYATGYWSSYGPSNVSGGSSQELIFTSPTARTVSLRVHSWSENETGTYALELIACPMTALTVGGPAVEHTFGEDDCSLLTDGGQAPNPTPVKFFSYEGDSGVSYTHTFTRVSGTSNIRGRMRGPDLDYGCYTGSCTSGSTSTGAGPYSLLRTPDVDGRYTVAIFQQTAGTLTASARVVTTPIVVASTDSPR